VGLTPLEPSPWLFGLFRPFQKNINCDKMSERSFIKHKNKR
jgi:hypothetical protein